MQISQRYTLSEYSSSNHITDNNFCDRMSDRVFREIKNLNEFLKECLGKPILEYSLKPLTEPGDNYGSELQAIEVKMADVSDTNQVK